LVRNGLVFIAIANASSTGPSVGLDRPQLSNTAPKRIPFFLLHRWEFLQSDRIADNCEIGIAEPTGEVFVKFSFSLSVKSL
jgi:hypothetical protein